MIESAFDGAIYGPERVIRLPNSAGAWEAQPVGWLLAEERFTRCVNSIMRPIFRLHAWISNAKSKLMLTFSIISVAANPALDAAVQAKYDSASYQVAPNVWFVSDTGVTAQEVCRKLGVKDATNDGLSGIIAIQNGNYFGHASKNIWEWLSVKISTP